MTIDVKEMPLFLTNDEWTTIDPETGNLILTDKAPKEAIDSYNDFMKQYDEAMEKAGTFTMVDEGSEINEEEQAKKLFGL